MRNISFLAFRDSGIWICICPVTVARWAQPHIIHWFMQPVTFSCGLSEVRFDLVCSGTSISKAFFYFLNCAISNYSANTANTMTFTISCWFTANICEIVPKRQENMPMFYAQGITTICQGWGSHFWKVTELQWQITLLK